MLPAACSFSGRDTARGVASGVHKAAGHRGVDGGSARHRPPDACGDEPVETAAPGGPARAGGHVHAARHRRVLSQGEITTKC